MGRVEENNEIETPKPGESGEPVASQPPPQYQGVKDVQPPSPSQPIGAPWSTGLFDCHLNQINAVMTSFLPCVTFGQIAEVLDAGEMTCPLGTFIYLLMMPAVCSQWIMGSKYRTKLRQKYNLVEAPYSDIVSHIFCPCCSLCQEFRELQHRGLDPALGWNGIVAQQHYGNQQVNQAPQVQSMSK
ncbi:protein PLANT CADMIUM RESISTANCE 8 [Nicotiana sylvestris]|uniref:Cadmium resistance protein 8 n=2 Tax=Nicotiana TaxID=4085 RepID=X5CRZ7_TOBAC|nr:PREDICTED: protein PLANT CADMIUM RESISTANCE 8 [Nicotiana sylvestris]XP_016445009.1 PREDICTED: protein PLANT CADMIUM RESISTANCE 8-like [Nicotiana tabacum]AHW50667.1 cadmium resistance protein 8 [Nicotiana tabacum]